MKIIRTEMTLKPNSKTHLNKFVKPGIKQKYKKKYFDQKYFDLKKLKKKRDELIHPKKVEHLHESNETAFKKIKEVFNDYDSFINKLMDGFFISVNVDTMDFLGRKKT